MIWIGCCIMSVLGQLSQWINDGAVNVVQAVCCAESLTGLGFDQLTLALQP